MIGFRRDGAITEHSSASSDPNTNEGTARHIFQKQTRRYYIPRNSHSRSPHRPKTKTSTSSSRAFWLGKERFHFQGEASPIKERDNGRGSTDPKGVIIVIYTRPPTGVTFTSICSSHSPGSGRITQHDCEKEIAQGIRSFYCVLC
ncbi:hypothetical protein CEXT_325881 [Caerostris extrusa]|uniref:Uncharacterized protein n=1 Tax=Caerostris extrusa TaxID=172846 RepID=A0AAV4S779_CAEEX|nr:hypothetical protein CEXT_325881 [Caerostris extrusa]